MSTKIEVEWVAQSQQMNSTLERINEKLDKQEKKLEQIAKTSRKSAEAAAGSFAALSQELKEAEDALKAMAQGTEEFEKQKAAVDRLRGSVAAAKQQLVSIQPGTYAGQFRELVGAWNEGVTAATDFIGALQRIKENQEQVIRTGADAVRQIDAMTRSMQVQMGLTKEETMQERQATLEVAKQAGVTPDVAFGMQTQLSSSAFERGALDTMLKIAQATNFEGNPQEVVQGIAQVLNAYQLERDNANTERLGASIVNLFRDTDLQMQDLGDFAKNAAVFENAGLKLEQSLAAFASLRNIYTGEASGTGLRNFVGILQSAGGQKSQTDALASMGLKPGQVDFVGEDLTSVIQTLRKATEGMAPEKANVAMAQLFGRENVAVAQTLLQMDDEIAKFTVIQSDVAALHEKAIIKREGMDADVNRLEIERLQKKLANDDQLHQLEMDRVKRQNTFEQIVEDATLRSGAEGAVMSAKTGIASQLTVIPGLGSPDAAMQATGLAVPQLDILATLLRELVGEQKATREEMKANQKKPVVQAPGRPKEDPLPAATAP